MAIGNEEGRTDPKPAARPLVSVVMPVFNDIEFVDEAVRSILDQTYRNLEILILIEHGSSDGTAERVKRLRDPRLRVVEHPERRGVAKSVNIGMRLATGTYVARMDGDDISLPPRIEKQVAFMEGHPEVVICGSFCQLFGDEDWQFRPACEHERVQMELLLGCAFIHPSVMFRRREFFAAGLAYDESLGATEDYDLWSRAARKVKLANVPEILLRYRKHRSSATLKNQDLGRTIYRRVMKMQLERLIDPLREEECDFHFRVFNGGLASEHELAALRDWFERLDGANRTAQVYDPDAFRELLAGRLLEICRHYDSEVSRAVFGSSVLSNAVAQTWPTPRRRVADWFSALWGKRQKSANA